MGDNDLFTQKVRRIASNSESNLDLQLGGVTATRMLKRELAKLRFADFVKP